MDDGCNDDSRDRTGDLDHVIWDTVGYHLSGLGDQVVECLVEAKPVDWEEKPGVLH